MQPEVLESTRPRFFYGWVIAGTFMVVQASAWGGAGTIGVFVNPMGTDMGWSRTSIAVVASILLTTGFIVSVLWGWLSDRWSTRGVIALSGLFLSLGFFLAGFAENPWHLYLCVGLFGGIGLGGSGSSLAGITSRWFVRNRGLAVGIGFAGASVGQAFLPILADRLITLEGWRSALQVLAVIILGTFAVAALLLKEPRELLSDATDYDRNSMPLSAALRTRTLWLLLLMHVMAVLNFRLILVNIVSRTLDTGIASAMAASVLTVLGISSMVGKVGGGAWGDVFGPRRLFIVAMALQGVALLWLNVADQLWMFYLFAAAFGLGSGTYSPQLPVMWSRTFGTNHLGAIYGSTMLGGAVGGFIGPAMGAFVFDTTGDYSLAFNIGIGVAIVAIFLAFLMPSDRPISNRFEKELQ